VKNNQRAFLRELRKLSPKLAEQFRLAIRKARKNIDFDGLMQAITARNYDAAFAALRFEAGLFSPVVEIITLAFMGAGGRATDAIVSETRSAPAGARVIASFDVGNPRAAELARAQGAGLVRDLTDGTREMVTEAIREGLEKGHNPRKIAREIAGRKGLGGRRGGLIGLDNHRAGYVKNARRELADLDASYFTRRLRNRNFDRLVAKAIKEGKPLTAAQIDKIAGSYSDRLLYRRAEDIARTEVARAQIAGQREAMQQLLDGSKVRSVEYVWEDTGDGKTRPTHAEADGQRITHGETFTVGGYQMLGPGDSSLGAPASETVNCRCWSRPVVKVV
jgi:hypothetical protein